MHSAEDCTFSMNNWEVCHQQHLVCRSVTHSQNSERIHDNLDLKLDTLGIGVKSCLITSWFLLIGDVDILVYR